MRTSTNFFLAQLAFADLLVSVFCICQNMFHVVGTENANWPLGAVLCKLYVYILHMVPCTSIGILVCVSLEKYIAVLHPLLGLKILRRKLRVTMTLMIWAISLLVNLPYYFSTRIHTYSEYSDSANLSACTRDMSSEKNVRYLVTFSFLMYYCLPLAAIAFLYTRIGMVLWKNDMYNSPSIAFRHQSDSIESGVNTKPFTMSEDEHLATILSSVHNSLETSQQENLLKLAQNARVKKVVESRKKVVRLLIAVVCSFAIFTLPHHARLLYLTWFNNPFCNNSPAALLQPMTYLLLFFSSTINPILYAYLSRRFREAVNDIIKKNCPGLLLIWCNPMEWVQRCCFRRKSTSVSLHVPRLKASFSEFLDLSGTGSTRTHTFLNK
uniref:G_PROTEIN_RECEP_F1_2 domain-containing protein n=1 Tax=Steinernema glaseri TaxID=37863 RepID=A0A1I7Y9R9_9BILA